MRGLDQDSWAGQSIFVIRWVLHSFRCGRVLSFFSCFLGNSSCKVELIAMTCWVEVHLSRGPIEFGSAQRFELIFGKLV